MKLLFIKNYEISINSQFVFYILSILNLYNINNVRLQFVIEEFPGTSVPKLNSEEKK